MSTPVARRPRLGAHAARPTHADRRRFALTSAIAAVSVSLLLLLNDVTVGPAWVYWLGSLVAVSAALGVVLMAQVTWERAINAAESEGLVEARPAR